MHIQIYCTKKKKKQKYSKADYYFLTMKPNLCIYTNVQVDYIHNSIGHIVKKKKKKDPSLYLLKCFVNQHLWQSGIINQDIKASKNTNNWLITTD